MKVYYDKDADLSLIKAQESRHHRLWFARPCTRPESERFGRKGDGRSAQGRLLTWSKVEKAGLKVEEVAKAVKGADVVMMLLPDENIPAVYYNDVEPNIKKGAALAFAHLRFQHPLQLEAVPRADLDVIMVAPKGPGHTGLFRSTSRVAAFPR